MSDTSLAHLMSWTESTKGDVPPPLTGPSVTLSPISSLPPTVFVFGGKYVQTRRLTNEMWALDVASRTWTMVEAGDAPGPRYFHSMDIWEDKLVCFGGMSDTEPISVYGDIWFFDCRSMRWLPRPSPSPGIAQDPSVIPSPRYAHLSSVSRGKLVVTGGQHSDNSFLFEINIYDLRRNVWTSKTLQPEMQGLHSKGAYRSVAISSKSRVIEPAKGGDGKLSSSRSYAIDEEGEGGEIWCYSNYDFAKVRRELDIIAPADLDTELIPSPKYNSPPAFSIRDDSRTMRGSSQPPGLRFPTGGIVGNHLVLCGLYLASTSAAFSVWTLDLSTMVWRHIEPLALATGSWNKAVIWQEGAKLIVFGNLTNDLSADYGRRSVNLEHVAIISLETYGIYQPPKLAIPQKTQEMGLSMLDEKLASDFSVVCDDGRVITCNRRLLAERWAWFAEEEKKLSSLAQGIMSEAPSVDINDTLHGSFNVAQLTPTSVTIPEPYPVCLAFIQYLYTLSLSTPLQNRAPVLSALLFLAKQYKIERLAKLVVHALHDRLEPSVAVGVYEIATLSGEQNLQVRALGMVHAARNASTSKSHRQGPPGSVVSDGQSSAASPPSIPSASIAASSEAQPRGRVDESNFRRARVESVTLAPEDAAQVTALLAALDVSEPARCESPTERTIPRLRHHTARLTPSSPQTRPPAPPIARTRLPSRPQAPDSTYSTPSSNLHTPSKSLRESFIMPLTHHRPLPSRALSTLEEDEEKSSRRHFHLSPSTLENAGLMPTRQAPPSSYHPRNYDEMSQYSTSSQCPSLTSASSGPNDVRHYSVQTHSSSSSFSMDKSHAESRYTDFTIDFDAESTYPSPLIVTRSRTGTISSTRDGMSISSGSTGTSSKAMAKLEKKMRILQAEKDAKKTEQQRNFERLRAEQQKKMALSRAKAQREAELEAAKPVPVKEKPKSRFGRLGQKLSESVLFPEGGKNSTMF